MKNTAARKTLIANSAADFAEWLNASNFNTEAIAWKTVDPEFSVMPRAKKFALDRIRPLVELILDCKRDLQKQKKSARFDTFEKYEGKFGELLNEMVKRYPIQPILSSETFATGNPTFGFDYNPIPKDGREIFFTQAYQNGRELIERLNEVILLASEDVFASFRRCALPSCGKYFYALRPERCYCSKRCQRNQYMEHPLRTKKNAADQKVYYYTRKVLDLGKVKTVSAADRKAYDQAETNLNSAKRAQKKLQSQMGTAARGRQR
jgi:hypothetical protein